MIRSSETTEALNKALVNFHLHLPDVHKDSTNPHFRSTFASLAANIIAADHLAAEHGLCLVQLGDTTEHGNEALTTRICHASGEWMEATAMLSSDPQKQASATTYSRRYNYQGGYGLVAQDDDGEGATHRDGGSAGHGHSVPTTTQQVGRTESSSTNGGGSSPSIVSGGGGSQPDRTPGGATTKQANYATRLAVGREMDPDIQSGKWFGGKALEELSSKEMSTMIDILMGKIDPPSEEQATEMVEATFGTSEEPF